MSASCASCASRRPKAKASSRDGVVGLQEVPWGGFQLRGGVGHFKAAVGLPQLPVLRAPGLAASKLL